MLEGLWAGKHFRTTEAVDAKTSVTSHLHTGLVRGHNCQRHHELQRASIVHEDRERIRIVERTKAHIVTLIIQPSSIDMNLKIRRMDCTLLP